MSRIKVRKEVMRFAEDMERILRDNDYKGGWGKCSKKYLLNKLQEEILEVYKEKYGRSFLRKELIDVANICMMLWDKEEGMKHPMINWGAYRFRKE